MIYFTSDTHYYHMKMAHHRGFDSVVEMNEALIKAHNDRVLPNDTVYHLGDVSFAGARRTIEVLERLNGKLKLVPGNHDEGMSGIVKTYFELLQPIEYLRLQHGDQKLRIVLSHFPILSWRNAHHGAIHLHGHSHGTLRFPNPSARIMDVGVDANEGLAPVSLDEVLAHMVGADHKPFDQHEEDYEE